MLICSAMVLSTYCNGFSKTRVVFACENKHNFPYYIGDSSDIQWDKPGASIEFLKLLENHLDIMVEFRRMPWKRCLASIKKGKVDGIFNTSFRSERMELGNYPMIEGRVDKSRRITRMSYVLYKQKGSSLMWDEVGREMHNLDSQICAPLGYSIVKDLKSWNIPVYELLTTDDCMKILASGKGRFAGIATLEFSGDFYLNKNKPVYSDIVKVSPPLVTKEYYLMLSRQFVNNQPEISNDIWKTIGEIRPTEFKKIINTYLE